MRLIRWLAKKILPPRFYPFVANKIYLPIWEIGWRLGLVEATLSDICQSPRAVEYPWVLRNIEIENGRILDVGCKGTLFSILLASIGFEVWGIDISDIGRYKSRHPNFRFVKGDVQTASLPDGYFDVITIISTIEHIGLKDDGDIECMERLRSLLKDKGKIILTVPYGSPALFKLARVYDGERLAKICQGLNIEKMEFFKELAEGKWVGTKETDVCGIKHTWEKVHSIVCLVARKDD